MLSLEVKSTEVNVKTGVTAKGRPYELIEQTVILEHDDERRKIRVTLPKGQALPYPVGRYTIDPSSFYVDAYGQLSLSLRLKPLDAAKSAPRAA